MWWNDLVGSEGLSRVDEGGEDSACLFAFACATPSLAYSSLSPALRFVLNLVFDSGASLGMANVLLMLEGSGLFNSGILSQVSPNIPV